MVLDGTLSDGTGICGGGTITTISTMVDNSGAGVDTAALVCIFTACELCTATTKVIGAVCARTGICGGETTTTSHGSGCGVDTDALDTIFTVIASFVVGPVPSGSMCALTGICGRKTNIVTDCTVSIVGSGVGSGALASTSTESAFCVVSGTEAGGMCDRIGTSTEKITTTVQTVGSGAGLAALGDTSIDCGS
jgi:hypothetical protein